MPACGQGAGSAMPYADHAASAPCLPAVAAAISLALQRGWGNPASRHHLPGRQALAALDLARQQVASLIGAHEDEVVFTSGATEACNLAIQGVAARSLASRPRLLAPVTEHEAVRQSLAACARAGAEVVELPVDGDGRVASWPVDGSCALVCCMLVNNETGVVQQVAAAAEAAHAAGALLFCDATQAPLRMRLAVRELGCDLLALSAHKLHGPPGAGCLWLRRGLALEPLLHGGGQERGLRSGTPNLPGIVGFGVAASLVDDAVRTRIATLGRDLEGRLRRAIPGLVVHGAGARRAPGISMVGVTGLRRGWLAQLATVAASPGSSCTSAQGKASRVLLAMGVTEEDAGNALRLSLGASSTAEEVAEIAGQVVAGARRLGT